ncbi:MAG: alpha/beta fold hydrolase [Alphaproteobacteria bacterium]|nr:alpha/beta fold hydrolase [Alphaproteobacteria bacterium]
MESSAPPAWRYAGADWPSRQASRFVAAGGLRWHVQIMGTGPCALLLHGTGSATHSWRDLAPRLAGPFTVVAPGLPGHGFTGAPPSAGMTLPGMARLVAALCAELKIAPVLGIGHSAGAAVLVRHALDGAPGMRAIASLNGALLAMRGGGAKFCGPAEKLLASLPLLPSILARRGQDRGAVERLLRQTGSRIDEAGLEFYRRLMAMPGHIGATLDMMAGWDLPGLERDLPRLGTALAMIVGGNDLTVPPDDARRVRKLIPQATIDIQPGLGHLAHEEEPAGPVALILARARDAGIEF